MNIKTELNIVTNEKVPTNPRTLIIRNQKKKLMTVKPVVDETYGTVYQKLFLNDYVIYALLRNKQDFTSCSSTNRAKAIELAKDFQRRIEKYLSLLNLVGEEAAKPDLPISLGENNFDKKELFTQILEDIKESVKKAEDKYNLTTGV